ncbi:MAG: DUF5719 family protein [Acidobacteria bacterium]|nr:DUF5719 family protein [Acidobacteriota bacterium]
MADKMIGRERPSRWHSPILGFLAFWIGPAALAATHELPLLPSASDALREGVVRILNHSGEAGVVAVTAIDDTGAAYGPVELTLEARQAIHFSSADLELGNAASGIATGIGGGQGDWRLLLETALDIEPRAYVQTSAGFIDGLDDTLPRPSFYHRVSLPAPDPGFPDGGRLRLINGSPAEADVVMFGIDDAGRLAPGHVTTTVPGGGSRTLDARELQLGASGLDGRLGAGAGHWRVLVFADVPIEVMALLNSATGALANLSAAALSDGDIAWFPAAGGALREGLLRVASRSGAGPVRIHAVDDAGRGHGPVTLNLVDGRTATLDSNALEQGDPANGLPVGVGDGAGDWRIRIESALALDIAAYVRTQDGFLTSAHRGAAPADRRHYLPRFNSAGETGSTNRLRLVNPSQDPAQVTILGWDDEGVAASGGAVGLTIPAGTSRSVGPAALEEGAEGLSGQFGQGEGSWRLAVRSDRPVRVLNLSESSAGQVTLLGASPAPAHFPDGCFDGTDANGNGLGDDCEGRPPVALLQVSGCTSGRYIGDVGANPGLVGDCRVLVGIVNDWARAGHVPENHRIRLWGKAGREKLDSWPGIEVSGGRIAAVDLGGSRKRPGGLGGALPPELGQLTGLTSLNLSYNRLTGTIPAELGRLTRLTRLDLSFNRLSGAIPPELGSVPDLRELNVANNRLTGTVPWVYRNRVARGDLAMHYGGNAVTGLEVPPPRPAPPVFSPNPADNGNASHHSVAYYQGPLVWEWNWQGAPREHQRPLLGRWAVLAVRVDHETAAAPPVVTRVLDSSDAILAGRLNEAAPPSTELTAPGRWRTEYLFELPGSLYRAGHRIVHEIDPDNDMAETDETDNVGAPIALYGEEAHRLRITFIPVYFPGQEPPSLDAALLMRGIAAFWPVADDFQAVVAAPLETDAASQYELLTDIRARWNAEADPDEFYYGIFAQPWPSGRGISYAPGRVAVSEFSEFNTIPHEFGHNLDLQHPPGCDASRPDLRYPYPDGALGDVPGWDPNWRHLVSSEDTSYADVMSYCGSQQFVSGYHYRKASNYLRTKVAPQRSAHALLPAWTGGGSGPGPASANLPSWDGPGAAAASASAASLALSGRIDASGHWRLTHVVGSTKAPRPYPPQGAHTLVLFDGQGRELYRESLSADPVSHGDEGGWAARVPNPPRPPRELAILDARGTELLRRVLPVPPQ